LNTRRRAPCHRLVRVGRPATGRAHLYPAPGHVVLARPSRRGAGRPGGSSGHPGGPRG
jgi:hypothetical protein